MDVKKSDWAGHKEGELCRVKERASGLTQAFDTNADTTSLLKWQAGLDKTFTVQSDKQYACPHIEGLETS